MNNGEETRQGHEGQSQIGDALSSAGPADAADQRAERREMRAAKAADKLSAWL